MCAGLGQEPREPVALTQPEGDWEKLGLTCVHLVCEGKDEDETEAVAEASHVPELHSLWLLFLVCGSVSQSPSS